VGCRLDTIAKLNELSGRRKLSDRGSKSGGYDMLAIGIENWQPWGMEPTAIGLRIVHLLRLYNGEVPLGFLARELGRKPDEIDDILRALEKEGLIARTKPDRVVLNKERLVG
jgi:hypothetical protein